MNPDTMVLGLSSEWAILLAIFILTSVQLVKVILDSAKNKREKAEREKRMHTLDKIEIYLSILSNKYTEEVTERQLPVLLKECLGHCRGGIIIMAGTAITKNDVINNEREVTAKVTQYIHNHFHSTTVNLGLFKWKGRSLSEFLHRDWCNEVTEGVVEIVIKTSRKSKEEAYDNLGTFLEQKFNHFATESLSTAYEL